ncbi:MAG: Ig-like domain-containing protein, partial [Gammaproteobacteria bacterium]|nr:Ig-like domain-containing protein [Gammaproteobacteria bacterium]
MLLLSCGGGSGDDSLPASTTIDVFDGAATGCTVTINGIAATELGEGQYSVSGTFDDGIVISATGCTDSDTGLQLPTLAGVTQSGGAAVSPITTLIVQSALASDPTATSFPDDIILAAVKKVITNLGLTGYDPIDPSTANYVANAKADTEGTGISAGAMRIALALSTLLKGAEISAETTDANNVITAIAKAVATSTSTIDLSSSTAIATLLNDAGVDASASVADALAVTSDAIAESVAIIVSTSGFIADSITVTTAIVTILNKTDKAEIALSSFSDGLTSAATSAVDKTAPTIINVIPAGGVTGASRTDPITVTFSEDILATSVDATTFTLSNSSGSSISGTVSFDGSTNAAIFTPASTLDALSTYTTTLSTGITDLSGNALASSYSWSFTTAGRTWGTAEKIETDIGYAYSPQIAVDGSGNAIAVWNQSDSDSNPTSIWANRFDESATSWGTATKIETDAGAAGSPQIAFDGSGNAIAVWYQSDGGNTANIWANKFDGGTSSWGTAEKIETDDSGYVEDPQIAFDGSGNAIAIWQQYDGSVFNIWANRFDGGTSSWGSAEEIETDDSGYAEDPQIVFDGSGNAIAIWPQYDGNDIGNIWANRFDGGASSWGTAEKIETNDSGGADLPQIAFDDSGNAIAVWPQYDGNDIGNIWANR